MTADDGYEAWLRSSPAPDLQELLRKHGGYAKIPVEEWAEHDRAMAEWQERGRARSESGPSSDLADPERLCVCGLPGVYWQPRKKGKPGGPIWRCRQHRNLWPDFAVEVSDAADDFSRSIDEAYAAIRARIQSGGEKWEPK